ncbi:MAG: hypothetical protein HPY45_05975 [Anaerolineae bacterium]|nr:hypothetical protein [Anaerolineae bacterium]
MSFLIPVLILLIILLFMIVYLIDRSGGWQQIRRSFFADPLDIEGLIATLLASIVLLTVLALANTASDAFTTPSSGRERLSSFLSYLIAPGSALIIALIAGASFIRDVYELPLLRYALRYLIYSVFRIYAAFLRPRLVIDDGQPVLAEGQFNSLNVIGGPGDVIIQPGNAVIFRNLRSPSRSGITMDAALRRFETIGQIAVLDDQHEYIPELGADREIGYLVTRDGIRIVMRDIHYRYRIISRGLQDPAEGKSRYLDRTLEDPYPFDLEALRRMANNRNVAEQGLQSVQYTVRLLVQTEIRNEISKYTFDQLTAPKENYDVRTTIRNNILDNIRTWNIGVKVISLDIGHFAASENVLEKRIDTWAAEWAGSAEALRARAEGTRLALEELGRAEAQMQFIFSVVSALKDIDFTDQPAKNIQKLLSARTARVFEAMRQQYKKNPPEDKRD